MGGLGSAGAHVARTVSLLVALASDLAAHPVQACALHSLALVAETNGPLFRAFVEPALLLVTRLVFEMPAHCTDLLQLVARLLNALITILGPELLGIATSHSLPHPHPHPHSFPHTGMASNSSPFLLFTCPLLTFRKIE